MLVSGHLVVTAGTSEKTAQLHCALGEFNVRDERIQSLDVGEHPGMFEIAGIEPGYGVIKGKVFFAIVAVLKTIAFTFTAPQTKNAQQASSVQNELPLPTNISTLPTANKEADEESEPNEDEEIFGTLWPLQNEVKLDASLPRMQLRSQAERLRQLGYRCDNDQVWRQENKIQAVG